jgi:hypoxanthine phosphoribosyltransferase
VAVSEVLAALGIYIEESAQVSVGVLLEFLRDRKPRSVKICTLLHKPERARRKVPLDFVGFTIPNQFVLGYGLDFEQKYRNLPYIGYVEPDFSARRAPGP